MTFWRQWCLIACSLTVGLIPGCTPAVKTVPISGVVKFNSKPIEKGLIEFYPIAPTKGPMEGRPIEQGAYTVPVTSGLRDGGKYLVRITASRKTGKKVANIMGGGGDQLDLYEQYLPAKYHKDSKLEISLADQNKRKFDFDLTGDEKKPADSKPTDGSKPEGEQVVTYRIRSTTEFILSCFEQMQLQPPQTSIPPQSNRKK